MGEKKTMLTFNEWIKYSGEIFIQICVFESWVLVEGCVSDHRIIEFLNETLKIHMEYKLLSESSDAP